MARALVLGSTGYIGAHIVRALLAEGHEVRAAYHREQYLTVINELPVERVRVDLETSEGLPPALAGCEWVFHAAGYYPTFGMRRAGAIARGVESLRNTLERIQQANPARLVFTSSAATIQRQRTLYADVKIAMEAEAMRAAAGGMPMVVTNPSICLGEYDAHAFSGRLILAFAKYRMPCYVDHVLNLIYTGDAGVGHVRAAERGRVGAPYLLTTRAMPLKEFAELVARLAGTRPPRWRLPSFVLRSGQALDGSATTRELGLPQTPIEEAVRRALSWFRASHAL